MRMPEDYPDYVDPDEAFDCIQASLDLPCEYCQFGPSSCRYWQPGFSCWIIAILAPEQFRVDGGWDDMYWSNWYWQQEQLRLPLEAGE